MKIENLLTLDIKKLATTSQCIIVSSDVNDNKTLFTLLKFGNTASKQKRLGMVLNLGKGITLGAVRSTPNLPFIIAARSDWIQEQFLCPLLGQIEPVLQSDMCDKSYTALEGKKLNVAFGGFWPYAYSVPNSSRDFIAKLDLPFDFYKTTDGSNIDLNGVDIGLMKILQEKMKFDIKTVHFSQAGTVGKVRKCFISNHCPLFGRCIILDLRESF